MSREPLLHFVILGALLFALWGWLAPEEALVVRASTVARIAEDEARRLGAEPSPAQLDAAIQAWIDDELLYREGLALGLDRGDPLVRRRVVQKVRFLHEDVGGVQNPTDAELRAVAGDLRVEPRVGFEQVFLRRDAGGDPIAVREALVAGADPATLGDPFVLGRTFTSRALPVVERDFGAEFAMGLMDAKVGEWTHLDSPFGRHVVRVTEQVQGRAPTDRELRELATATVQREAREANAAARLQALRDAQPVRIER